MRLTQLPWVSLDEAAYVHTWRPLGVRPHKHHFRVRDVVLVGGFRRLELRQQIRREQEACAELGQPRACRLDEIDGGGAIVTIVGSIG